MIGDANHAGHLDWGVIDTIDSLIVVLDREGKIVRYNRACSELTGFTPQEVEQKFYWDVFCLPEEVELYKAFLKSTGPVDYPFEVEAVYITKGGEEHTILWLHTVLLNPDRTVKYYILKGTDVTARKESEKALRELGEKYRALIHALPVAVISLNGSRRINSWSAAAERIFGWPEKEVWGKDISLFLKDRQGLFPLLLNQALRGKSIDNAELYCWRKDGSPVHINLSLASLRNYKGEIDGAVLVAADITDRKLAEATLLEERNKALNIHKRSLPRDFSVFNDIYLAAYYQPAQELRGDFYNVIRRDDRLLLYLTDVAGKGLDGVMLSIFVRDVIENFCTISGNGVLIPSPAEILNYLMEEYSREKGVYECPLCIFLAVIDLKTKELRYVSSGYSSAPLATFNDGIFMELHVEDDFTNNGAATPGHPDGTLAPVQFPERHVHFSPGSVFLFSTDGLFKGGQYGPRLKKLFKENCHLPPELIVKKINEDFMAFNGSLQAEDDIAFLVVQAAQSKKYLAFEVESDFSVIEKVVDDVLLFLGTHIELDTNLLDFHEMLTNAIEHGNKRDGAKKVFINIIIEKNYYKIVITDQGEGFNWRERLERELDLGNYHERGRGIMMTKMLCDYIGYNDSGNRVTLINLIRK